MKPSAAVRSASPNSRRQGSLPAGGWLLEKPFTADQLASRVRETIAGGSG